MHKIPTDNMQKAQEDALLCAAAVLMHCSHPVTCQPHSMHCWNAEVHGQNEAITLTYGMEEIWGTCKVACEHGDALQDPISHQTSMDEHVHHLQDRSCMNPAGNRVLSIAGIFSGVLLAGEIVHAVASLSQEGP